MWSTFYEIVDDTSQIAKAHSILAESITNQILGPFEESIKTMDMNRRRTLEEANSVSNELNEAFSILRRATQQLEDTTNEVNATRLGLSRAEGAMTIKPRELERTRTKYQTASEKLAIARASYRQCDDVCRSLQNKVQMVDFPRISRMLSSLEAARSTETRQILLSSARLERRTAEMDVQCAVMMEEKVGGIALDDIFDNLMMTSGGVNGSISGGGGGGNCGALNEINGTNLETDARRYSITRPLVARTGLQDQSSNTNPSNNNSSTPRTLAGNPVPSYYPSATFKASAEILDRKNVGSQIIQ